MYLVVFMSYKLKYFWKKKNFKIYLSARFLSSPETVIRCRVEGFSPRGVLFVCWWLGMQVWMIFEKFCGVLSGINVCETSVAMDIDRGKICHRCRWYRESIVKQGLWKLQKLIRHLSVHFSQRTYNILSDRVSRQIVLTTNIRLEEYPWTRFSVFLKL